MSDSPQYLFFAQHGWADTNRAISYLVEDLATPDMHVVVPNLGYIRTWLNIQPLIRDVEAIATETLQQFPTTPLRIVGHSMGGLIWAEVLHRHPEWWPRVESFVLIASPINGSDWGRLFDPFGILNFAIARDLGRDRREMAEAIAAEIPTFVIAGDADGGSDGTVPIEATKIRGAKFLLMNDLKHAEMRWQPKVAAQVRQYWENPNQFSDFPTLDVSSFQNNLIHRLQSVAGITPAHYRDFKKSKPYITYGDGTTIRTWKNPARVDHVFVANAIGSCLYGGFIGWTDAGKLKRCLRELEAEMQ